MTQIYMIRHGKAAAGWDSDPDPALDTLGQQQADAVAETMAALVDAPLPILTSPLKRCQQTAAPLAKKWGATPRIEPRVSEIPPPLEDLSARTIWLRRVMAGTWAALYDDPQSVGHDFRGWYKNVLAALLGQSQDVVIFSHFLALNVGYCAATGAQNVVSFMPDNASLTIFATDGQSLSLVKQGREAQSEVNLGKK